MKTIWNKYSDSLSLVMNFNEEYINYLSESKTERENVRNSIVLARKKGFKDIKEYKGKLKPNDKVYFVNREKNLSLYIIGKKSIVEGLTILGAHIDSPRVDLKQNPVYESDGLVLFDTHYYGGVKKYQWVATPMALHGVVAKKDGSIVNIVVGEKDTDPVVGFSDLLIHLAQDQMKKDGAKVVEGEDLNLLVGSMPLANDKDKDGKEVERKEPYKDYLLKMLKDMYNIEEADFKTAELEIVPAGKARSYGLDSSMVIGYGHDDRVCAYTSLRALFEMENPERTLCCILTDKEEVGSIGATGMQSRFFENTIAELIDATEDYNDLKLRKALRNSFMLSSDVSAGYDPNYPAVFEKNNSAFLGKGLVFNKYTGARGKSGCNDANPEFIAKIFNVLDNNSVDYQTAELGRVDQGGGGTIAYILANLDMEVIDAGVAVQNMHAPWEVVSKVDVYEAFLGYQAFLKDIK
jgi:aspartyl aminopeptidase